jgi:hypothetical protein
MGTKQAYLAWNGLGVAGDHRIVDEQVDRVDAHHPHVGKDRPRL